MTNAEKYIYRRQPADIMNRIAENVPDRCPLYVLTGHGMSNRCKGGDCKRCAIAWLCKEEEKEIKKGKKKNGRVNNEI